MRLTLSSILQKKCNVSQLSLPPNGTIHPMLEKYMYYCLTGAAVRKAQCLSEESQEGCESTQHGASLLRIIAIIAILGSNGFCGSYM